MPWAWWDDGHAIVSRVSVPIHGQPPAAEVVRDMGGAVEQDPGPGPGACPVAPDARSMGVGSPGTCNSADGVVERAYNLGWDHVPVCRMLEQRFGIPCRLSNDANCAALAEQVAGAAVGHDNVVLVTLGTGVGGGIIIGGRIYDGMRGAGAELGHTLLVMDGEPCTCGRRGCWEAYSSATALIRQACQAAARHPDSLLARLADVNGKTVFDAADRGDETAQAVVDRYCDYLGAGPGEHRQRPGSGGHSHRRRHQPPRESVCWLRCAGMWSATASAARTGPFPLSPRRSWATRPVSSAQPRCEQEGIFNGRPGWQAV